MVLSRALVALLLVAGVAGCGQSLFDAHGGGKDGGGGGDDGGGGGDGDVPDMCTAPCVADAAADYDGSPRGVGGRWRYLDDKRDRTWTQMATMNGVQLGAVMGNSIRRCASDPSAAACQALPGALLISSAGAATAADPALELTSGSAQTITLVVRAHVPGGGAAQKVRLYRNSREDVLVTADATPGATVERQITVDALPGDRFLVALAPTGQGGQAALHFFVNPAAATFPATCQLAASFSSSTISGNVIDDLCAARNLTSLMGGSAPQAVPPMIVSTGPFAEQGQAINLPTGYFFNGPGQLPLSRTMPVTIQLWVRLNSVAINPAWLFWDLEADLGGGAGLVFLDTTPTPSLEVQGILDPLAGTLATARTNFPTGSWRFVRMVEVNGTITVCVDGTRAMSINVPAGRETYNPPYFGRHQYEPAAYFDGMIDDVRAFYEALPCN